jgi:pimeloyl-ACP methyl ester carboxylesterase
MDGRSHSVTGADGVKIGLLTDGAGPAMLLVHGRMGSIDRWEPVWPALTAQRR